MGYSKEVHQAVQIRLDNRRARANSECEERKRKFFEKYPEAEQIERKLAKTSLNVARAVIKGKSAREELEGLRNSNLKLQERLDNILLSAGVGKDYLDVHYHCKLCNDRGNVDGKVCECTIKLLKQEAYKRINSLSKLKITSFDEFDLSYYPIDPLQGENKSPRKRMTNIFNYCVDYAKNFTTFSKGLLMTGGTGLGKTHLSLAIAKEVINRGYGVIYTSVPSMVTQAEKEHFSFNAEEKDSTISCLMSCDLLILDDLGTEFFSKFSVSTLYNIINSRALSELPTIISTNLSLVEIEENYSQRMVSRIIANCVKLDFIGRDIRQIRNL